MLLLLILGVGGCSFLVYRAATAPIDAGNQWLVLLDEQRWDEAIDSMCPQTTNGIDRAEAESVLVSDFGDGIDDYRLSNYQNNSGNVSVGGRITVGGEGRPLSLAMEDGTDGWRVCRYAFVVD